MARFIVLQVEDDSMIEPLLTKLKPLESRGVRHAGTFGTPSRWCACPHPEGYHKGQIAVGAKYGWWVCTVCRRPRMGGHQPTNMLRMGELPDVTAPAYGDMPLSWRITTISIDVVPTANVKRIL